MGSHARAAFSSDGGDERDLWHDRRRRDLRDGWWTLPIHKRAGAPQAQPLVRRPLPARTPICHVLPSRSWASAHVSPQLLGAVATGISAVNITGGFLVTKKMLDMFKRPTDPPEYYEHYGVPTAAFIGGYAATSLAGFHEMHSVAMTAAGLGCIGGIAGLASQSTARHAAALSSSRARRAGIGARPHLFTHIAQLRPDQKGLVTPANLPIKITLHNFLSMSTNVQTRNI